MSHNCHQWTAWAVAALLALAAPLHAGPDSIYGIHFYGSGAESIMNARAGYDVETTWVQNKTDWSDIRSQVQNARNAGFTPIVRFNWAGGYTVPALNDWTGRFDFAVKCREGVQALGDLCNIWVIGNEMNMAGEGGIPADWYLKCFNSYDSNNCYTQIHNVQGSAIVCIGAVAPNNADTNATGPYDNTVEKWKNYWYYLVNNSGLAVDGFAVHAYGGRQSGQPGDSGYDPDPRDDLNLPYGATADTIDVCWGFNHFRYFVDEVATKIGDLQRPIYITETNTGQTAIPSTSYRAGWIPAAYEAIDTWNKTHYQKINALCWFVYAPMGAWMNYELANPTGNCVTARNDYIGMTSANAYVNTANTPDLYVYNLNTGASNQSSSDPNQIVLGSYVGRWENWQGALIDWGSSGPFGVADNWVVIQTRHFYVPSDGTYNFNTTSDDGSWLWVDGKLVVNNYGLHGSTTVQGSMNLTTGYHSVFVKFFDSGGGAVTGYQWQRPGAGWETIPDSHPPKGNATVYHADPASSWNSSDMSQIIPASYVGSFGWNGVQKIWGKLKGPLGQTTDYIVQQGGVFWAPSDGTYTFRTGSCDGSWLWIDGQVVVNNYGLGRLTWISGTKSLTRGWHMIWYKGFYHQTNSSATQCYEAQPAGTTQIDPVPIY